MGLPEYVRRELHRARLWAPILGEDVAHLAVQAAFLQLAGAPSSPIHPVYLAMATSSLNVLSFLLVCCAHRPERAPRAATTTPPWPGRMRAGAFHFRLDVEFAPGAAFSAAAHTLFAVKPYQYRGLRAAMATTCRELERETVEVVWMNSQPQQQLVAVHGVLLLGARLRTAPVAEQLLREGLADGRQWLRQALSQHFGQAPRAVGLHAPEHGELWKRLMAAWDRHQLNREQLVAAVEQVPLLPKRHDARMLARELQAAADVELQPTAGEHG